jgi:hypothetical protein
MVPMEAHAHSRRNCKTICSATWAGEWSAASLPEAASLSIPPPSPPIWWTRTSRSFVQCRGPDKFGGSERAKGYEDYVKSIVNPDNPTPRGWGFQLPNPAASGALVFYDDCQHVTGMMVEAKGPGYANLLTFDQGKKSVADDFTDQAKRQIEAAGDRPITWYFAEPEAAAFARELFSKGKFGERINVEFLPWPEEDR